MSSDRFMGSLRGSPLHTTPHYQRVLRQPQQRRRQSPSTSSSSVGTGMSTSRLYDFASPTAHHHVVSSPAPLRPQTPPPATATRAYPSAANLSRSISQRKDVLSGGMPLSGGGGLPLLRSSGAGGVSYLSYGAAPAAERGVYAAKAKSSGGGGGGAASAAAFLAENAEDVQPAIRALERVLDAEINDLRRVTEKLERRVSSILSLEEHRQLLVQVTQQRAGGSPAGPRPHATSSSPTHSAVNEVLLRVGALQLASPVPPASTLRSASNASIGWMGTVPPSATYGGGDSGSVTDEYDARLLVSRSAARATGGGLAPFIVDLEHVDARRAPPPHPALPPPPQTFGGAVNSAAVSALEERDVGMRRKQQQQLYESTRGGSESQQHSEADRPGASSAAAHAVEAAAPSAARQAAEPLTALISARLSSTELALNDHQQQLLALQSEIISQQRQFPENAQLSRLRVLLRDELSLCKRRESRLVDLEEQANAATGRGSS